MHQSERSEDEQNQRLVWITEAQQWHSLAGCSAAGIPLLRQDGRRSVWSRTKEVLAPSGGSDRSAQSATAATAERAGVQSTCVQERGEGGTRGQRQRRRQAGGSRCK